MEKSYNLKRSFIATGLLLTIIMLPTISSARILRDVLGDCNENGKYDAEDARLVLRQSIGAEKKYRLIGDFNMDGKVTASDSREILRVSTSGKHPKYGKYILFNQNNYQNTFYTSNGKSTIAKAGCSVTSTSIVLSRYGMTKEPYALGVNRILQLHEIKNKLTGYGLNASYSRTYTKSIAQCNTAIRQIKENLEKGNPVIALVREGPDKAYCEGSGHYIVLVGIKTENHRANIVTIIDPNGGLVRRENLNILVNNYIYANSGGTEMGYVLVKGLKQNRTGMVM